MINFLSNISNKYKNNTTTTNKYNHAIKLRSLMSEGDKVSFSGNIGSIIQRYQEKTKNLPLIMDGICERIGLYASDNMQLEHFVGLHNSGTINLAKRMSLGKEGARYSKTYKNELSLISEVTSAVKEYTGKTGDEAARKLFNEKVQTAVLNYINAPVAEGKKFII
jgi:hypothetical protein